MASVTELSFSWYCFATGILANIFASARGVFGKKQMSGDAKRIEALLSPENYYAVLTIISFVMLIPLMLLAEGSQIFAMLSRSSEHAEGLLYSVGSGLMFYLYNEVSFQALNDIHPVSHALANTLKRIVIIITSFLAFKNPIKPMGIAGTVIAIAGVGAYSLAQHYTKPQKATKVDDKKKS